MTGNGAVLPRGTRKGLRMRVNRLLGLALAASSALMVGCWYQRPNIEDMYGKVEVGMTKDEVIDTLGQPTTVIENDMFYLYDDPLDPVRLRFVLDEKAVVIEKYYEPKKDLARKAEETKGEIPPVEPLPTETEPGRPYVGGPLERFDKPPGQK